MTAIVSNCRYCGQEITRIFKDLTEAVLNSRQSVFCNEEHKRLFQEGVRLEKVIFKFKPQQQKPKQIEIRSGIDICSFCKVHYKDCLRMQSGFKEVPEGSQFDELGKLIHCPNFRS